MRRRLLIPTLLVAAALPSSLAAQPTAVVDGTTGVTLANATWRATPDNWRLWPEKRFPAVRETFDMTCTLVRSQADPFVWEAQDLQASLRVGPSTALASLCSDQSSPEGWPDVAVLDTKAQAQVLILVSPGAPIPKNECQAYLCLHSSVPKTWTFPVVARLGGKVAARKKLTIKLTGVEPQRQTRYWQGTDGYWNVCVREKPGEIRSSGGRLYCDVFREARGNVRMTVR